MYTVELGDTVVSIAAKLTGDPARYAELVDANPTKPRLGVAGLEHPVFASLEATEKLNVPAGWGLAGAVGDATIESSSVSPLVQAIGLLIQNTPNIYKPANLPAVASVLVNWWPHLAVPPNSISVPPYNVSIPINVWSASLASWLVSFQNASNFGKLVRAAEKYWVGAKTLPTWSWNAIDWQKLEAGLPSLINQGLGMKPALLPATLSFMSKIRDASIVYAKKQNLPIMSAQKSYAAPNFVATNWSDPAHVELFKWLVGSGNDPTKIPWDLLLETESTACYLKNTGRLALMQQDQDCYTKVCYGDPVANFKRDLCAGTYTPGWCKSQPCTAGGNVCIPLTCAQIGVKCGVAEDECGGQLNCGACASGQQCVKGECIARGVVLPPCVANSDCPAGQVCVNGECAFKGNAPPTKCVADGDCADGQACVDGICTKKATSVWVYIAGAAAVVALGVGGYAIFAGPKRNPSAASQIPKSQIDWLVGNVNVGVPDAEVREDIEARARKAGASAAVVKACGDYAIKAHRKNQKLYGYVMRGR